MLAIPHHLRSPAHQVVLEKCERVVWPLVRQPRIGPRGGLIRAPFSFEVFLDASDCGVLRLLNHYRGYARNSSDDFLVGGEREVGSQLSAAASRQPARFISFLSTNWNEISDSFRDDVMDGVGNYLAYRYGNLQPTGEWSPKEEPEAATLSHQILNELESHSNYWHHNRVASRSIQSCAPMVAHGVDAERLVALATGFSTLLEANPISGSTVDLINIGINMARGNAADALMVLANQLEENKKPWPESLLVALRVFAGDEHPAIRAVLLRRMPQFQVHHPALGWELFDIAIKGSEPGLWAMGEPCLYHAYHQTFAVVSPWLEHLRSKGIGKDLETWGRISALAGLSKRLTLPTFLAELRLVDSPDAWRGATSVWTHLGNMRQHREQCLFGLAVGLAVDNQHALACALKFRNLFHEATPAVPLPLELFRRCFQLLESSDATSAQNDVFGVDAWLNATALRDPMYALEATEIYLDFVRKTRPYIYDHENNLTQLLTRLFAHAEEQEESDGGALLLRAVAIQDAFLSIGVDSVSAWLRAAERP